VVINKGFKYNILKKQAFLIHCICVLNYYNPRIRYLFWNRFTSIISLQLSKAQMWPI